MAATRTKPSMCLTIDLISEPPIHFPSLPLSAGKALSSTINGITPFHPPYIRNTCNHSNKAKLPKGC